VDKCAAGQYLDGTTCKACPAGHKCLDKCTKTLTCVAPKVEKAGKCALPCAVDKKYNAKTAKCEDCGECEICDGSAIVKECKVGQFMAAGKKCTACTTGHTCDKCKQTKSAVVCKKIEIGTATCIACPTGYKCDGKGAVALLTSVTTPKTDVKATKPKETTPGTMSDAEAWSTAIPLFITAFAAIVV